jgi:hypothetical protein
MAMGRSFFAASPLAVDKIADKNALSALRPDCISTQKAALIIGL